MIIRRSTIGESAETVGPSDPNWRFRRIGPAGGDTIARVDAPPTREERRARDAALAALNAAALRFMG